MPQDTSAGLTTWTSPDNKTARQIDYIMINHKYRNAIRKAYIVPGWRSNMGQQQQHGVPKMEICLRLMRKYKTKIPQETGTTIKYDIQELRKDPQKITRWINQRKEPLQIQPQETATQAWGKLSKYVQNALKENYPLQRTSRKLQEPEWANQAKQWSTPEEWGTFQEHNTTRNQMQINIGKLDKQTIQAQKKSHSYKYYKHGNKQPSTKNNTKHK